MGRGSPSSKLLPHHRGADHHSPHVLEGGNQITNPTLPQYHWAVSVFLSVSTLVSEYVRTHQPHLQYMFTYGCLNVCLCLPLSLGAWLGTSFLLYQDPSLVSCIHIAVSIAITYALYLSQKPRKDLTVTGKSRPRSLFLSWALNWYLASSKHPHLADTHSFLFKNLIMMVQAFNPSGIVSGSL